MSQAVARLILRAERTKRFGHFIFVRIGASPITASMKKLFFSVGIAFILSGLIPVISHADVYPIPIVIGNPNSECVINNSGSASNPLVLLSAQIDMNTTTSTKVGYVFFIHEDSGTTNIPTSVQLNGATTTQYGTAQSAPAYGGMDTLWYINGATSTFASANEVRIFTGGGSPNVHTNICAFADAGNLTDEHDLSGTGTSLSQSLTANTSGAFYSNFFVPVNTTHVNTATLSGTNLGILTSLTTADGIGNANASGGSYFKMPTTHFSLGSHTLAESWTGSITWISKAFVIENSVIIAATDTLAISYPANNSSVSDFSQWSVNFDNEATSPAPLSLGIRWGTTSTPASMEHVDYLPYSLLTASTTLYVPKNIALQSNTTYWAQAFNLDSPYEVSPVISFNTGNVIYTQNTNPPSVSPFPSSTNGLEASSSPFFIDCSQYQIGLFSSTTLDAMGCQIKKTAFAIIGFLVSPPEWASQSLQGSVALVKQSFPFSIPTLISNAVSSTQGTYATSSVLSYGIPDLNGNLQTEVVASSTSLHDFLTTPTCNTTCAQNDVDFIFGIETAIIWVSVAFTLIRFL